MTIDEEIFEFKRKLKTANEKALVREYITSGNCRVINQGNYSELKNVIADHFKIHPNEVIIVGSAKLGFSLSENLIQDKRRFRHFSESSDIDVAIISQYLFDDIWKLLLDFIEDKGFWAKQKEFTSYHFHGWMRPDMLPNTPRFSFTQKDWWGFFNTITNSQKFGSYKIRGGLYRNWDFLEKYQIKSINQCKMSLNIN